MEENEVEEKPAEKDPQLARLEQIYLKKNINYFPEKESETTFDKMSWTEADLEHLRKQRGEGGQETAEEVDEEIRSSTTVPVNIQRPARKAFKLSVKEWWATQTNNTDRQINAFLLVNSLVTVYCLLKMLFRSPSSTLFFILIHRWVVFQILKVFFGRQRNLKDRIAKLKYWMPALDLAVTAWLPLNLFLGTILLAADMGSPANPELFTSGLDLPLIALFYANFRILRAWFWL